LSISETREGIAALRGESRISLALNPGYDPSFLVKLRRCAA
jgi:hypothetical protein